MRIAICHFVCGVSAKELAEHFEYNNIKADVFKVSDNVPDPRNYDAIFAYGMGSDIGRFKERINSVAATTNCIDKRLTFNILKRAGVPTVEYVFNAADIPKKWEFIVCRKSSTGRRAEDMEIIERGLPNPFPDGKLFTEYFDHKYEYRVVVFKEQVVGHYFKKEENGQWIFNIQPNRGFEEMDKACIKAAKALGIDYVGFDVVANTKKDFRILEANSGPVLTEEAGLAIVEYFLNK